MGGATGTVPAPLPSALPGLSVPERFMATRVGKEAHLGGKHPEHWASRCAIHSPCTPFKQLPHCTPNLSVLDRLPSSLAELEGQTIAVRGSLSLGSMVTTAVACRAPTRLHPGKNCCNALGAQAIIHAGNGAVGLDGLGCGGDESRQCCDVPAFGQTVVAAGRLRRSAEPVQRELLEPMLCVEAT